jgi:hypothetical protein
VQWVRQNRVLAVSIGAAARFASRIRAVQPFEFKGFAELIPALPIRAILCP